LRALGCKLVVITLGALGCRFFHAAGSGHVPGERVEVVDSTGAGDAFTAGLLADLTAHLANGRSLDELGPDQLRQACARGNQLGALAVTRLGATAGLPRRP
jgi:fructokinase